MSQFAFLKAEFPEAFAGGAFSITEHPQVIARMGAPAGYQQNAIHVVAVPLQYWFPPLSLTD